MDYLVLNVDWGAEPLQAKLHHFDSPHYPGAEPAGRAEDYFHDHSSYNSSKTRAGVMGPLISS
jgi:hypothetical protein